MVEKKLNFWQRVYTVLELRTGFVAGTCALLGSAYGAYINDSINWPLLILLVISAFCFNIVANVANEIRGVLYQEETEATITGHYGSEGLVRKDAKISDAIIALILVSIIGIVTGLSTVFLTKDLRILLIGMIGFAAAILYSLTKIAYIKFPIGEFVSGLMCGFLCVVAGIILQTGTIDIFGVLLAVIAYFMVSFLMAANNTVDYQKDLGKRLTLSHILGFRNSIIIIIPQLIIVYVLWLIIGTSCPFIITIIGLIIITYYGIFKWYIPYFKITEYREGLAREFGPKPLLLILNFNFIMSAVFLGGI